MNETIFSVSPSASVSLARTFPVVMGVSSVVSAESSTATGTVLAGPTVTTTVPTSDPPFPSETVYVKLSVPVHPAGGV